LQHNTIQQFGFLVAERSKDQATSELEIALDHAILKNGTEIRLALGIQAIGRSQANAAAMADDLPATSSTAAIGCLRFLICDQPRCHRFARHEPVDANLDFHECFRDQFSGEQHALGQRDGDDLASKPVGSADLRVWGQLVWAAPLLL